MRFLVCGLDLGDFQTPATAAIGLAAGTKAALEAAGASLDKVVKVTITIAKAAWFPTVNAIYARSFPHDRTAHTFVIVGSWPLEFNIEVECIAA
jgi:enamine deaminase RidA (YjgF/YER057c/UK114 family)